MFEKIKDILQKVMEGASLKNSLTLETDLINDVGLDSLQMISFILEVEEAFLVEIDYEDFDIAHMKSIEAFMAFLNRLESKVG